MSRARCTLKVRGLDCNVERDILHSVLNDQTGVLGLGFDLILGTMTVDYEAALTGPDALIRRVSDQAGMAASLMGPETRPEGPTASRWLRWGPLGVSGALLLSGIVAEYFGFDRRIAVACYGLAVVTGGFDLFPKAFRGLRAFRFDIHVLMGLASAGALILGQWDEAATVVFLFGISEALESLSLDRARRAVRALLEVAPTTAGVYHAANRESLRSTGAFPAWASRTLAITREIKASPKGPAAAIVIPPSPLIVPAKTSEPGPHATGTDSPVIAF